jgi:hypothetical protein
MNNAFSEEEEIRKTNIFALISNAQLALHSRIVLNENNQKTMVDMLEIERTCFNNISIFDRKWMECDYCSICQEKVKGEEEVFKLSCSHIFHSICLVKWAAYKGKCPICSQDLKMSIKKYGGGSLRNLEGSDDNRRI